MPTSFPPTGAAGLAHRLLQDRANEFAFEPLTTETTLDTFEITAAHGGVRIRGNSEPARTAGLYRYLTAVAGCSVTWDSRQLDLPTLLPSTGPIRATSPWQGRYYFNPCTFSYSTAFWDWARWEREIDWMALHGITMPLALTGQEAIWQAVYRDLGLTDDEIAGFLAGPAFLPFGWMGCLDAWGGPLSQHWIDAHADLQQRIVARERELGMTPVLQGFTGHVPTALDRLFPESRIQHLTWTDFPPTGFLDPRDPLFVEIGSRFIREQSRRYGTDHIYAADSFIEMEPESSEPAFLAEVGNAVYAGMATADPDAIWVMQGWTFQYKRHFWQPPQIRALLDSVADDRLVLLDLWAEEHPTWQETNAFHGKPWLWCMLHNFGGRPGLCGRMPVIAREPALALASESRGNLAGIGIVPEAIEQNAALYELMSEVAWHDQPIDLDAWIDRWAVRRYGMDLPETREAWRLLGQSVYDWQGNGFHASMSLVGMRPGLERLAAIPPEPAFDHATFRRAWELLLAAGDRLAGNDAYQRDLVDVSQQALATVAVALGKDLARACATRSLPAFREAADRMLRLVADLDRLVATRPEYLLGTWIASARRWGTTPAEQDRFEWNARTLVTLWGKPGSPLNDYSRRHWSGLLGGFYLPRWQRWSEAIAAALAAGQPVDETAVTAGLLAWEEAWSRDTTPLPTNPTGDAVAIAHDLFTRYASGLGPSS
jgi:alpha-N-acetylglucosaminidase